VNAGEHPFYRIGTGVVAHVRCMCIKQNNYHLKKGVTNNRLLGRRKGVNMPALDEVEPDAARKLQKLWRLDAFGDRLDASGAPARDGCSEHAGGVGPGGGADQEASIDLDYLYTVQRI